MRIITIIIISLVSLQMFGQVKTLNKKKLGSNTIYFSHTGGAADTLTANQDTIRQEVVVNKNYPYGIYLFTTLDTIDGEDTAVYINVYGKMFEDESWSKMITDSTGLVTAAYSKVVDNLSDDYWTITADTTALASDSTAYYSFGVSRSSGAEDNYMFLLLEWIIKDEGVQGVTLEKYECMIIPKQ